MQNAMVWARDTPEWEQFRESRPRIHKWVAEDRLADAFLMQLGEYPDKATAHLITSRCSKKPLAQPK